MMNTKRILPALAALAILATGCNATGSNPTATVTVTAKAQPAPVDTGTDGDAAFVSTVSTKYPDDFPVVLSDTIVNLGESMCSAMDRGATWEEIVDKGANTYGYYEAGFILGAAVTTLCPDHADELPVQ